MVRAFFPIIMLFCCVICVARAQEAASLCAKNEETVFSCKVKNSSKTASVCFGHYNENDAHYNASDEFYNRYIQYRFGEPEKLDLVFPTNKLNSQKRFFLNGANSLSFVSGGYLYTVNSAYDSTVQARVDEVVVEGREKRLRKKLECDQAVEYPFYEKLNGWVSPQDEFIGRRYYHYYDATDYRYKANAQLCTKSAVDLVGKFLRIENFYINSNDGTGEDKENGIVISEACAPWSGDPGKTVAAFSYGGDAPNYEARLAVVLIDEKSKKIVASYLGAHGEDAVLSIDENTLGFNEQVFELAPGKRTISLDFTSAYGGGRCWDGGVGPERTVFVREGQGIRPVLSGLYISSWRFINRGPNCDEVADTKNFYYSLETSAESTNGFANLLFIANSSISSDPNSGQSFRCALHYDGKKYSLPYEDKECSVELGKWEQSGNTH